MQPDEFRYDSLPGRVVFGRGTAHEALAAEVETLGISRLLLIASPRGCATAKTLTEPLGDKVSAVFTAVREHVPVTTAQAARAAAAGCDGVLAIGGGSTIGAAKAVALTTGLPIVAVPTTYAGSEVTPVWGLTDGDVKTTGTDLRVLPRTIVYDPELLESLPDRIAAESAFNALAHCVDSLWAPRRNPVSAAIAEEGVRALVAGLAGSTPSLLKGAYLAGSALAGAGSGLHHKLCHVLGGLGMPHARTHAVVLPHVLAFNAPGAPDAVARLARAADFTDPVAALRELSMSHGIGGGLRGLGLRAELIDEVVARTEPVVPADNPVPVGDGALRRLVVAAWEG